MVKSSNTTLSAVYNKMVLLLEVTECRLRFFIFALEDLISSKLVFESLKINPLMLRVLSRDMLINSAAPVVEIS